VRSASAVLVGGAVGTSLRLLVGALLPAPDDGVAVPTLVVNVVGAFVLGVLVGRLWPIAPDWLRLGLGTGLLGSFTTFSAFAASTVALGAAGAVPALLLEVGLTLVLGLGAAALGVAVGGRPAPATADE